MTFEVNRSDYRSTYRRLLASNDLPTAGLTDEDVQIFEGRVDDRTIGFGALRIRDEDALLRSLVVEENVRGNGYGEQLVETLLERARDSGVQEIYLLTTTAADFFEALGFERINRTELPESIRKTDQVRTLCPESATVMTRSL